MYLLRRMRSPIRDELHSRLHEDSWSWAWHRDGYSWEGGAGTGTGVEIALVLRGFSKADAHLFETRECSLSRRIALAVA